MHPTIIAQRKGLALDTIFKHARKIAAHFGYPEEVTAALTPSAKDPLVRELYRLEAIADFMARVSAEFAPVAGTPELADGPQAVEEPVIEEPAALEQEALPAPVIEVAPIEPEADAKARRKKK